MPRMKPREVKALLAAEKSAALGASEAAKLSDEREKALNYYLGDMQTDMPSQPDRSAAISTDVADTVEGLMPSLMEIFCGGDQVVEFQPHGQEDEDQAAQETDYVNHVFMQKNAGFMILYSLCKDALLSKNGIAKIFWEKKEEIERATYYGLDAASYGLLRQRKDVKVIEHTERVGEPGKPPQEDADYG